MACTTERWRGAQGPGQGVVSVLFPEAFRVRVGAGAGAWKIACLGMLFKIKAGGGVTPDSTRASCFG